MTVALTVTRPRRGAAPKLTVELGKQLINLAAAGVSRRGAALLCHIRPELLRDWLERGAAQPGSVPYGSFSRDYQAATRIGESLAAGVVADRLMAIARKPERERSLTEVEFCARQMNRRFPVEHAAGQGLAHLRQPDPELNPEEWWQQNGLEGEQLRALLRDPPDTVAEAMVAEGDAVYALLLARGWKPKP